MKNTKFVAFLESIQDIDNNVIMDYIIEAYNLIYESSEDVVNSIKSQLGTEEENPLDQKEPKSELEFPEEPDPGQPSLN
jgi:hypothetical protein